MIRRMRKYNHDKWGFGPKTTEFLKELGHRLRQVSGEANSFAYLTQRLSVAVQRGNAASVLGTIKTDSERERVFSIKIVVLYE